jgi:hypothetical protein
VLGVRLLGGAGLAALGQPLQRVLADRLQHRAARLTIGIVAALHQMLIKQRV